MSILNQTNDGLFNVLIVLVRSLVCFGPRARDDLMLLCGGAADRVDTSQLNKTLNRWTELGLFVEEKDAINIAEPYLTDLGKNADCAELRLPKIAGSIVFLKQNNERFWEAEGSRSADLSRGVAWMLAQDVYSLDESTRRLDELEGRQLSDPSTHRIVQNDTRWNGLKSWMVYLGFARESAQWVIDPTEALRNVLPDIFGSSVELTGPAFVERAGSVLPVLDGGEYRREVEAVLKDNAWPRPREACLSASLSRSIQRLDREGYIKLANRSDTEGVVTLTGVNMRNWRTVSHVSLSQVGETS